jgi:UDP-glucuronate decarboxylase
MKKKILITGGAGFIGSHLTERLVEAGHYVTIFDNLHRNAIKYSSVINHASVNFVQGDILDSSSLRNTMQGAEMVIHLAAIAGVSNYYNFPAKTLKVNLIGTYNVIESMRELGINSIIDMSTSETYGVEAVEVDETSYHSIGPADDKRWCYAGSKIGGEQLIFRYAEEYGWNATIIRPFNIYGPRQIGEKKNLRIEGSGMAIRSWCYISDFVDALMSIINNQHKGPEAFNVGNPWSIASTISLGEEVIRAAKNFKNFEVKSEIDFVKMDFTEIKVRYPKVDKLMNMYDWKPKINLPEGVYNTLDWFKNNYEKN